MTKPERGFLVLFSVLLLAGAVLLYIKQTRPRPDIIIVKGGVKEERSLKEVKEALKEARVVDINTATMEELQTIPGIGESYAARIIEYRNAHGGFEYESDLLNVEGIGEKKLEKIKEYIRIE